MSPLLSRHSAMTWEFRRLRRPRTEQETINSETATARGQVECGIGTR
jgi:hypothetical protein